MLREKLSVVVLSLLAGGQLLQAAEPVLVATPRASVLATTAASQPFLAAAKAQQPVNLAARGYAEAELLVSGYANIYEWAAAGGGEPVVRTANQPYATRILVRRPIEARRFSGRVIVEVLDGSAQYDTAPLWGFSGEHFLRRGDAWVGVTVAPVAAGALRKFNAARYDALILPASQAEACVGLQQGGRGSGWDVIAQVGALLRSSSKENPLLGLNPQRILAAGYAQGGESVAAFAFALHRGLLLGSGAPVFDGYLIVPGQIVPSSNPCAAQFPATNGQLAGMPRDVPFVSVLTGMNSALWPAMRDGDASGEAFRAYEVVGAEGAGLMAAGAPAAADLATAGINAAAEIRCREPLMDQTLAAALNASWQQLDDLLVRKQPLAILPRIETSASGGTLGGWRLPQVDLPLVGTPPRTPRVCDAATGSLPRFDAATLKAQYRDRNEYLRRFNTAVDQAVLARLLVKEDAAALKAATARGLPVF